ncbi:MAG: THUMP domain-containing protein [Candidatus Methanomethylicia archaeon]|nr:THUMP domain-containing protein [Candidatus Methanomethylicia archaeon]MCX8168929.1 THUMP domain-containing protein [Candidatus Methanomethylicia archaeon]MDW7988661.1 THUMP domain-containing protein [Nitrososphaerota archaeon]
MKFTLLISTQRGREDDCISELWYLLREIGEERGIYSKTGLPGLVTVKTSMDPIQVVEKLKEMAMERPWEFHYVLKVTPIEVTVKTDIEEIKEAVKKLLWKISENESFRVTVNKRAVDMDSRTIIEEVAELVDRKVNLESPDKVIQIEILGNVTGISIIKPDQILSITKIREEYMKKFR